MAAVAAAFAAAAMEAVKCGGLFLITAACTQSLIEISVECARGGCRCNALFAAVGIGKHPGSSGMVVAPRLGNPIRGGNPREV